MLSMEEKVIFIGLSAVAGVGMTVGMKIYGQYMYYSGKVDKAKELEPVIDALRTELYKELSK